MSRLLLCTCSHLHAAPRTEAHRPRCLQARVHQLASFHLREDHLPSRRGEPSPGSSQGEQGSLPAREADLGRDGRWVSREDLRGNELTVLGLLRAVCVLCSISLLSVVQCIVSHPPSSSPSLIVAGIQRGVGLEALERIRLPVDWAAQPSPSHLVSTRDDLSAGTKAGADFGAKDRGERRGEMAGRRGLSLR